MFCPQCGREDTEQTRFCRSCGMSLETVALTMAGDLKPAPSTGPITKRAGRRSCLTRSPVFYAILLIVIGVAAATVFGKSGFDVDMAKGISGLIAMLGVGLLGFKGVMMMIGASSERHSRRPWQPSETTRLETGVPRALDAPASVTEHTTRTLEPARAGRDTAR
jgi:hypothetical protein